MMKVFIFAFIFALATATKLKLEFFEKQNYYEEKINVTPTSVEYEVPKHEGVEEAKYLDDFEAGLIIMKLDRLKTCYAFDMPTNTYNPTQVAAGLKNFNGKFPENKYMVTNNNLLPLHYLNGSRLTSRIQSFCGDYRVIKSAVFNERKGLEEAALAEAKASVKSGNRQKRGIVTEFYACDTSSSTYIGECGSSGRRLMANCKFVIANTCVYKVACKQQSNGFNCPVPDHVFTYLHCCDYACK